VEIDAPPTFVSAVEGKHWQVSYSILQDLLVAKGQLPYAVKQPHLMTQVEHHLPESLAHDH
jgi:hypothetical protein